MTASAILILEEAKRFLVHLGEDLKLDEIHPPLAALDLGDEGVRPFEFRSDFPLSQLDLGPRFVELPPKSPVSRTVKGVFRHSLSLLDNQAYFCNMFVPKIGTNRKTDDARCL
jgi:hypothetical protein